MTHLNFCHTIPLALIALAAIGPARAGSSLARARMTLTPKDTGDRLGEKSRIGFRLEPQPDENFPTIIVDPKRRFQEIPVTFSPALLREPVRVAAGPGRGAAPPSRLPG